MLLILGTRSAIASLGRSNWLLLISARASESPPCLLDMQIYANEGKGEKEERRTEGKRK